MEGSCVFDLHPQRAARLQSFSLQSGFSGVKNHPGFGVGTFGGFGGRDVPPGRPRVSKTPAIRRIAAQTRTPRRGRPYLLQHSNAAVFARKLQCHQGPDVFFALDANLPAMVAHNTLHDHQTESVPADFGRVIGLK